MHTSTYIDPVEAQKKVHEDQRSWRELSIKEQQEIEFKFQRATLQLIFKFPFFGFMATRLSANKIWLKDESQYRGMGREGFQTMAVDGKRLYIHPQFVLYHSIELVMGVIMHELFHIILQHIDRGQRYQNQLANYAMDLAVNMMVNDIAREEAGINKTAPLTEQAYQAMPWYVPAPPFLYNEKYRDDKGNPWIWEKIYEDLLKQQDPNDPKTIQGIGAGQGLADNHGVWQPNQRPANEDGEVDRESFSRQEAEDMIRNAWVQANQEKMQGKLPGGMSRYIDEWLNPPLPWQRLVAKYLKPIDGWFGYQPGDLRFADPIPWFIPEDKLDYIVIAIDTSGSMSDAEVASAIDQSRVLLRGFPQTKGILCMCDAEVSYWEDIKETYKINRRVGYGGTSFHPPFEKIVEEKIETKTSLLIYFTDGYGSFPDDDWLQSHKIPFDTLWVVTNHDITPPEHRQYKWTRLIPK